MKWSSSVLLLLTGLFPLARCLPHQYHFIGTAVPWLKAQAYCREHHTDLATVFDIEDMNRLVNSAQDSSGGVKAKAWIGLHDKLTSWRWSFSDSGYYGDRGADYRNWNLGQPDNLFGNQMCVRMRIEGVWEDSPCFLKQPFICFDGTTRTSQRFIFVQEWLSWADAQRYCRTSYTDLASVRDKTENQKIKELAKNRSVWIGLHRTREWSDQSDSGYRNWRQGQPDNVRGIQDCVAADLGNAGLWSDEQCSEELVFICYTNNDETPDKPLLPITTTETQSNINQLCEETSSIGQCSAKELEQSRGTTTTATRRATTKLESITVHLSKETDSSVQPSTEEVDQTRTTTYETLDKTLVSITTTATTTTVIPKRRTTTETGLTTEITSFRPSSTTEEISRNTIYETPNKSLLTSTTTTTTSQNKRTTTETESTIDHVSEETTSSVQPSVKEEDQTRSITYETTNKAPVSITTTATTTMIPNRRTTTETGSAAEIISFGPSSTTEEQSRNTIYETPNKTLLSITTNATTITTPNKRTTTEIEPTSGHVSTETTSFGQPSTEEADQTRTTTYETPNKTFVSITTTATTTVTPNKGTTTETESTIGHVSVETTSSEKPSTKVDQTRTITYNTINKLPLFSTTTTTKIAPNKRTITETESTVSHFNRETTSSAQSSTKEVDQTRNTTYETPNKTLVSITTTATTTVTPNKGTTTETESAIGHFSVDTTSSGKPSTKVDQSRTITYETPNEVLVSITTTATTTVTSNKKNTTEVRSTTFHRSTETTSSGQLSSTEEQSRNTTSTTVTPNRRTTGEIKSTAVHVSKETTSLGQPSTKADQTRAITYKTPNKTLVPFTTTSIQVRTSSGQSSTTGEQSRSITYETPNKPLAPITTSVTTPNKRGTTESESASVHLSTKTTSSLHPSTKEVDQTRTITYETSNQTPVSITTTATTTVTPNIKNTTETGSTTVHRSKETTSSQRPSTKEVDQSRTITYETPNKPLLSSTTTTVSSSTRTTTEIESTVGPASTDTSSTGQSSTKEVHQTKTINYETPNKPPVSITMTTGTPNTRATTEKSKETTSFGPSSTTEEQSRNTTLTPNKRSTTKNELTTAHFSTETRSSVQPSTEVDQTRTITSLTALSSTKMTTAEGDSSSTEVSCQQYSTPNVDKKSNTPVHLMHVRVKFTSSKQLSEDDIKELVLIQFHNRLIEMGVPMSSKVGVKRPPK